MRRILPLFVVMLLTVVPLISCSSNNSSQNDQSKQSSHSKSKSAMSNDTGSGSSDNSNSDGSGSSNKSSPTSSSSTSDNSQGSSGGQQSSQPPKTTDQALKDISSAIKTKVPVVLPGDVPVSNGKYLTGVTKSETWYYNAQLYEVDRPTKINSSGASNGSPIALIEGTEYKSDAAAKQAVAGVQKVDTSNQSIDLGNGIKGIQTGGAGHAYITWNEGNWTLWVNRPSDPKYQNPNYKDGVQVAKNAVAYLHDHMLPAPKAVGVVKINIWSNSTQTTVQWQEHQMVYQVTSKEPMTALKVAVAMNHD